MEQKIKTEEHKDIVMTCTSFYSIPLRRFELYEKISTIRETRWALPPLTSVLLGGGMLRIDSKVLNSFQ